MAKSALITGIAGQDGGHLAALLHSKGYKVYGVIRGQMETSHPRYQKLKNEMPYVEFVMADLLDLAVLVRTMQLVKPDEVYNLAAISHVGYSFKDPILTADVTGKGVLNVLEAIRLSGLEKTTRFYQASTSEMFGGLDYNRPDVGYNEDSPFHPRSPYGVAKLFGHWITRNYRESYGMFAACGILFNHEGERRGPEFVTRKISKAVARIKLGKQEYIELGNVDSKRDWGYAGDYVEGMWRILQHNKPDDFVLATGETHSIREFCELAFANIGIDIKWHGKGEKEVGVDTKTGTTLIKINPEFYRPAEVDVLTGDPSKAEKVLGWKRKVNFPNLVKLMVDHDLAEESGSLYTDITDEGPLRHIVFFSMKTSASDEEMDEAIGRLKKIGKKTNGARLWNVSKSMDFRKGRIFIQNTVFDSVDSFEKYRNSKDHADFAQYMSKIADWSTGDYLE
ncbi:MAG: NAD-dependent epimerase/dehydratase [Candidatus Saccharibacteria bacterium]|nr:NAD-dependent epimerase/dehydratase [Candidatus Saccharibacteria bacterium]